MPPFVFVDEIILSHRSDSFSNTSPWEIIAHAFTGRTRYTWMLWIAQVMKMWTCGERHEEKGEVRGASSYKQTAAGLNRGRCWVSVLGDCEREEPGSRSCVQTNRIGCPLPWFIRLLEKEKGWGLIHRSEYVRGAKWRANSLFSTKKRMH